MRRWRVAVVEDDEQQQRIYTSALEAAGYEVRAWPAASGATDEIKQFDADAVVVDAHLPGLQGDSFILLGKKHLKGSTYFLLHSAMDPADLLRTGRLCGCDCVPKDGEAKGLLRKLESFFSTRDALV